MTGQTTCLHLVVSDCAEALHDCLSMRSDGDTVLFIDSGVLHLYKDGQGPLEPEFRFSGPDLEARGLLTMASQLAISILADNDVAELIRTHHLCLTWK